MISDKIFDLLCEVAAPAAYTLVLIRNGIMHKIIAGSNIKDTYNINAQFL